MVTTAMNNYLIYKHTSPSGKAYIGQTNNYTKRCQRHQRDKGCRAFANAINRYGWENFTHEILHDNLSIDEANKLESMYIAEHNTLFPNGYNLMTGGLNSKPSEETRAKMLAVMSSPEMRVKLSEAQKGKKHTPETKAKLSEASKGRIKSVEERVKISAANKGKKRTPEVRAKLSAAMSTPEVRAKLSEVNKGRIKSPETRAKLAAANKGKKHTPETKAKLSEAIKKKALSPEYRAKLSAAQKGKILSPESIAKTVTGNKSNSFIKMQTAYLKITLTEQQYAGRPLGRLLGVSQSTIKSHFQTNPVTAKQVHDYFNQPNPYTT